MLTKLSQRPSLLTPERTQPREHVVVSWLDAVISEDAQQGVLLICREVAPLRVKAMLLRSLLFEQPLDNTLVTFSHVIMCVE